MDLLDLRFFFPPFVFALMLAGLEEIKLLILILYLFVSFAIQRPRLKGALNLHVVSLN